MINISLVSSTSNSTGHWSTDGCQKDEKLSNDEATVCHCNHLTHFAVLMRVTDDDKVGNEFQSRYVFYLFFWGGEGVGRKFKKMFGTTSNLYSWVREV